MDTLTFLR
jgi:hypothetical protein